ncbi:MAG: hypothetical protein N2690_07210 [Rhodocyclaceae bacterium]|nr:hypothetical protein [Rhodocyclaceae bacterium]
MLRSPHTLFPLNQTLRWVHAEYNLGRLRGTHIEFDERAKHELALTLQAAWGLDLQQADKLLGQPLPRHKVAQIWKNEKCRADAVGSDIVWIKPRPAMPLHMRDGDVKLPPEAFVGLDVQTLLQQLKHDSGAGLHDAFVVVENYEAFLRIGCWCRLIPASVQRPVVVFRGSAGQAAHLDALKRLLQQSHLPVWAFVDFDPAGMIIANSLPRLQGLITPPLDQLRQDLQQRGLACRYQSQVAECEQSFSLLQCHPVLGDVSSIIAQTARALPQEYYVR